MLLHVLALASLAFQPSPQALLHASDAHASARSNVNMGLVNFVHNRVIGGRAKKNELTPLAVALFLASPEAADSSLKGKSNDELAAALESEGVSADLVSLARVAVLPFMPGQEPPSASSSPKTNDMAGDVSKDIDVDVVADAVGKGLSGLFDLITEGGEQAKVTPPTAKKANGAPPPPPPPTPEEQEALSAEEATREAEAAMREAEKAAQLRDPTEQRVADSAVKAAARAREAEAAKAKRENQARAAVDEEEQDSAIIFGGVALLALLASLAYSPAM